MIRSISCRTRFGEFQIGLGQNALEVGSTHFEPQSAHVILIVGLFRFDSPICNLGTKPAFAAGLEFLVHSSGDFLRLKKNSRIAAEEPVVFEVH